MTEQRIPNAKGQFVLPAVPAGVSSDVAMLVASYHTAFTGDGEDAAERWYEAADAVRRYPAASYADIAAKLIIAIHFHDPEIDDGALAIEAPGPIADRLATEMLLDAAEWLIGQAEEMAA